MNLFTDSIENEMSFEVEENEDEQETQISQMINTSKELSSVRVKNNTLMTETVDFTDYTVSVKPKNFMFTQKSRNCEPIKVKCPSSIAQMIFTGM